MSRRRYSVGVVGLGNIGMGYDAGLPDRFVLTHARASSVHPRTALVWGVDVAPARRLAFKSLYSSRVFGSAEEALDYSVPDIIVLALHPEAQSGLWRRIINAHPMLILAEKPMAWTAAEAEKRVKECGAAGVRLAVNYIRRSSPATRHAQRAVSSNRLGKLLAGNAWYEKGVFNSASHSVNLAIKLLGAPEHCTAERVIRRIDSLVDLDAEFTVRFAGADVRFRPVDWEAYSLREIDLLFESGRLRFTHSSFVLEASVGLSGRAATSYSELVRPARYGGRGADRYQYNVLSDLAARLDRHDSFASDASDAVQTVRICEQVTQSLLAHGSA